MKAPDIKDPIEWLVVTGNRVVRKFKSYTKAMKFSAKKNLIVVSRKSWGK